MEEPDCNIFLRLPLKKKENVFLLVPEINEEKCTRCGKCAEFCRYNALAVFPQGAFVFVDLCHSCGGCFKVCSESALTEKKKVIGVLEYGTSDIEFVRGVLNIGEAMATPVISALKKKIDSSKTVILDSPHGAACPAIETISGCDFCVLVTEPTPFGLHDLKLAVTLTKVVNVPCGVIINRAGIGDHGVESYCQKEGIPLLLQIPHSNEIAELCSRGIPFVEKMPEWRKEFQALFHTLEEMV